MTKTTQSAFLTLVTNTILTAGTPKITAAELRTLLENLAHSVQWIGDTPRAPGVIIVQNQTTTTPPGGPADDVAYVVAATATDDWAGKEGQIAVFDASVSPGQWRFYVPEDGWLIWDLANDNLYRYDAGVSPAVWTAFSSAGGTSTYDIPCVFGGTPTAGEIIGRFTMVRTVDLAANFSGSYGSVDTAPGAQFDIDVRRYDEQVSPAVDESIGTVSIATTGAYTFTTVGGTTKQLTAGQRIKFIAPSNSPAEATIDGIDFTLAATEG